MPRDTSPALSLRFDVQIDGVDLGTFTQIEGIEAEYEIEEYLEGGQNDFVHRLPIRRRYQNLRLTRAIGGRPPELFSRAMPSISAFA